MDPNNMVLVNRNFLAQVINSLKTMDVRGWESNSTLVDCINALTNVANQEPVKVNFEESNDGKTNEGEKKDDSKN